MIAETLTNKLSLRIALASIINRTQIMLAFALLSSCAQDVTSDYNLGGLQRGVEYTLQEDVFLREYNSTLSIHPPQTPRWAPMSILQFKNIRNNEYFIKDILPKGTRIKFTGAIRHHGYDHPITGFYGEIRSGIHESATPVLVDDLMSENGKFSSKLSKIYLGD